MKTRTIAFDALSVVLAMCLSYLESLIPLPIAIPGIRAGLPNLVIMFLLYRKGFRSAALISGLRVFLTALLFGTMYSFLYSLSGAALSILVMTLLKKTDRFSPYGVSIAGGVSHNAGQLLTAMLILGNARIGFYFPALLAGGVVSGLLIGLMSGTLIRRVPQKITE